MTALPVRAAHLPCTGGLFARTSCQFADQLLGGARDLVTQMWLALVVGSWGSCRRLDTGAGTRATGESMFLGPSSMGALSLALWLR